MAVDRAQLRKETGRLDRSSNVTVGEALGAVLIRTGVGDYKLRVEGAGGGGGGGNAGGLVPEQYTSVTQTIPAPAENVEEYVYALVPTGQATVTITYTDNTKATLVSAVRS